MDVLILSISILGWAENSVLVKSPIGKRGKYLLGNLTTAEASGLLTLLILLIKTGMGKVREVLQYLGNLTATEQEKEKQWENSTRLLTSAAVTSSTFRLPGSHLPAAQLTFPHFFLLPHSATLLHTHSSTPIFETLRLGSSVQTKVCG